jgi:hypothetical protein
MLKISLAYAFKMQRLRHLLGVESCGDYKSINQQYPEVIVDAVPTKKPGEYLIDLGDITLFGNVHKQRQIVRVYDKHVGTFNRYTDDTNRVGTIVE